MSSPHVRSSLGLAALITAAVALPTLLAFNLPPSPTLFNQLAALALWGWVVVAMATFSTVRRPDSAVWPLPTALAVVAAAAVGSWAMAGLPAGLTLSALALLAAAVVVAVSGAAASPGVLRAFFIACVAAGVCSAVIGTIQVFAPDWGDGIWIARSGLPGRAVGNVRQPNHLSSLLLASAVAIVPLREIARSQRRPWTVALFALFIFGITLSGSRTGGVGVLALAVWGIVDRRLSRRTRALLVSAPVIYAASWLATWAWGASINHPVGASTRLDDGPLSTSRWAIWRDTLVLIGRNPWQGVGFGEFNFAWTLTPFPDRAQAFFDHTHNLPLQLAVELGLPIAGLVLALLAIALWRAWRNAVAVHSDHASTRSAFVMVLMMALHSQLEYPLWYAYFLLPTAWVWGYCLSAGERPSTPARSGTPQGKTSHGRVRLGLQIAGVALVLGSAGGLADYVRVVQIFAPGEGAGPLAERIERGRRSIFFAHHADYAAATTAAQPESAASAFERAPHYLLDTRLMIAWAKALAAQGDMDKARHVAARLREFHHPAAEEFFATCQEPGPRPFQCTPPQRVPDWREFR